MSEVATALKKSWLSHDEAQDILEAENEFLHSGKLYDFSQVQQNARKELFASQNASHVSA